MANSTARASLQEASKYAFAVFATAAVVMLRWLLDPYLGDTLPLVTLYGAVAASVWVGGYRPAIASVVLGYVACQWLFIEPRGVISLDSVASVVGLFAYLLTCTLIIGFGEAMRRARRRLREAGGQLQVTLKNMEDAQLLLDQDQGRQLLIARTLAAIVESSDDAIISKSLDGIIQSWNVAAERLFGYTAGQAIGRHISLVIPPDRIAEEDEIIARLKAGERLDHFETERVRSDGERIQVSLTISPIKDNSGLVVGASKIVRDITERKRIEGDRQKFVTLVETSTDFIGMFGLNGVPFFVNRAGLAQVGLASIEEAKTRSVQDFFFPEDQSWIMNEFFPHVLATGHGEVEVRFRNFTTGEARWMAYKMLTLTETSGQPYAFATVNQDVTERRKLEDHLRTLAADLSDADRRKNEFLATLAHELRNPLAPISNAVQVLRRRGSADPAAVARASELLQRQVTHLGRLVDDLLDMSRITRGRIELRREKVDLSVVVEQVVEATRAQYRSMNHEFTIEMPDEPVMLFADGTRLTQVLGNLLNNACKFTDEGGRVSVSVERRNGNAEVRVRDNGIGIAADELPLVFDMFTQLDTSVERSRDGLGIGLTLVKNLVEMHDGTISVHSAGRGLGSEFTIRLPLPDESSMSDDVSSIATSEAASTRRVLVVDDNQDGAASLAMLLQLSGHETFLAHDGQAAINEAERLRPDVMLLDIGLPGMSGYEVCRNIREQSWGQDMVLVAVTGWGQAEDRHRSRAAGFDAHVVKPVDPELLTRLLSPLATPGATT